MTTSVSVPMSGLGDYWIHLLAARLKHIGISTGALLRLPEDVAFWGLDGPIDGTPETRVLDKSVQILVDAANARQQILKHFPENLPGDTCVSFGDVGKVYKTQSAMLRELDKYFASEHEFLLHHASPLATRRVYNLALSYFPSKENTSLAIDEVIHKLDTLRVDRLVLALEHIWKDDLHPLCQTLSNFRAGTPPAASLPGKTAPFFIARLERMGLWCC